jgi:hypothetical protein
VNLERGFRRITVVLSGGLLLVTVGLAPFILYSMADRAAEEAARDVLAGDKDFIAASFSTQSEIVRRVLRETEPLGFISIDAVGLLKAEAKQAAGAAKVRSWILFAPVAVGIAVAIALLPWAVFYVLRWIARGFSNSRHEDHAGDT